MKKIRQAQRSVIAAVVSGLSVALTVLPGSTRAEMPAMDNAAQTDTLRPEVKTILLAAKKLYDAKKIPDAIAKITETDAIANKTPYEVFAIERTRGNYYFASGDKANTAKAFEAVIAANYLQKANQLSLIEAVGQLYFQLSDYPAAIQWLDRYVKEGGTDTKAADALNKAHYLNKDYAEAYNGIHDQVQSEIAAGHVPGEQNLKLLLSCMNALKDEDGTLSSVELLNTYYPSSQNWLYLISRIPAKPGFSDKLYLDIFRLKVELSLMQSAAEYLDMSELATRSGLPAEAKKALDLGFAAGLLGKGPDAKKHANLLASANKQAQEDLSSMQQGEISAAKRKDGAGLVNLGMAYATAGQYDKAVSLIGQGIAKGGLARPDEAKLHSGLVYYWAGKKDAAIAQLNTVAGADGTADLARYWVMQIRHPLPKQTVLQH